MVPGKEARFSFLCAVSVQEEENGLLLLLAVSASFIQKRYLPLRLPN